MPLLDIIVLIPLAWFTIKGFMKGFIIELATLVALVAGVYLAYFFSDITASFMRDTMGFESDYMMPVSFVITFVAVVVLVFMLAKALEALVKTASLGLVNKLAGAVFGFAKMALILSLFIYQISAFDTEKKLITEETRKSSYTYTYMIRITETVMPLMKNLRTIYDNKEPIIP